MKSTGTKAGVPDIFWPVPRGKYHGLFIELKRQDVRRCTPEQAAWIDNLTAQGYLAEVCSGCSEALKLVQAYDSLT